VGLQALKLDKNWLTGTIPSSLDILPLGELYLAGNDYSCPLPDYSSWATLTDFPLATCVPPIEIGYCPSMVVDTVTFPGARVGQTVKGVCPFGSNGTVVMTCVSGGSWSTPFVCDPCHPIPQDN